jgi:hypothetical protein
MWREPLFCVLCVFSAFLARVKLLLVLLFVMYVNLEKVTGQERPNVVGISQIPRWNYYKPLSPLLDVTTVTPPRSSCSLTLSESLSLVRAVKLCTSSPLWLRLRYVGAVIGSVVLKRYEVHMIPPPCDYFSFVSYLCEGWLRLNRADLWALSRNNSDTLS